MKKPLSVSLPAAVDFVAVEKAIVEVRGIPVIVDADVAKLYGVESREVNQAVRRNPDKFPEGYAIVLEKAEVDSLRSQIVTLGASGGRGKHSKHGHKAFTEKGLYMLATILKSKRAVAATFAIIETFAKVRSLKRELVELHSTKGKAAQERKMRHFGETLADVVMPDALATETETSLELNFIIGKIKHTVRRIRRNVPAVNPINSLKQ